MTNDDILKRLKRIEQKVDGDTNLDLLGYGDRLRRIENRLDGLENAEDKRQLVTRWIWGAIGFLGTSGLTSIWIILTK